MITFSDRIITSVPLGAVHGDDQLIWDRSAAADFDGDGLEEVLITPADFSGFDSGEARFPVMLGLRDGALVDLTSGLLPEDVPINLSRSIVLNDFNGDGRIDVFIGSSGTESVSPFPGEQNQLYLSAQDGTLRDARAGLPALTDFSHGVVDADFDLDGDIDLFVNTLGSDEDQSAYLIFNDGTGQFSAPHFIDDAADSVFDDSFVGRLGPNFPGLIDVGADGIPDIYFPEIRAAEGPFGRLDGFGYARNDGTGRFTLIVDDAFALPSEVVAVGGANEGALSGDIDGDGDEDLVSLMWSSPTETESGAAIFENVYFQVFRNDGAGGYVDISTSVEGQETGPTLPPVQGRPDFDLVDLDGDGDLDLALGAFQLENPLETRVFLFENAGDGSFSRLADDAYPITAATEFADVNGDWLPDAVYGLQDFDVPESIRGSDDPTGIQYAAVQLASLSTAVTRAGTDAGNRIAGGDGDDVLSGLGAADALNGNAGNDTLNGGSGADSLFGGTGVDLAILEGSVSDYSFARLGDDQYAATCLGITDQLTNIEAVQFEDDGSSMAVDDAAFGQDAVYRFFNTATGSHFFTSSLEERVTVQESGSGSLVYEGLSFLADFPSEGFDPVHRFFNTSSGSHFFTIEADAPSQVPLAMPDLLYEGIAYYASAAATESNAPLYRFLNTESGAHFYTASESERAAVEASLPQYQFEGVAYYVDFL